MDNQKVAKMQTESLNQAVTREKQLGENGDNKRRWYWNVGRQAKKS